MKIIHFSDIHLAPLGHIPQSRTDSYHNDVAGEIFSLQNAIIAEKADIVVCSGDIFHLKNQSVYSPRDINYYSELFQGFPPFYSIPGNHDLPKSAYVNVKDSPYTSLVNALPGKMVDVSGRFVDYELPETGGFKLFRLVGVPYVPMSALRETLEKFIPTILSDKVTPTLYGFLIHVDATPNKMLVNLWESFSYQELADMFPKNSVLFMGHIHASFAPWQDTERNVTISKPWSVGRVIKDYFNTTDIFEKQHVPSYSVFTLTNTKEGTVMNMEYKPIPECRPGNEIFQVDSLQTQLEKSKEIQNFIQGLKQTLNKDDIFFTQDPMAYLQGLNLQKEVFDVITEYLNK